MSPHAIEHLCLAGAVLAFGGALVWLAYHLVEESPKDGAQRELDRKKR